MSSGHTRSTGAATLKEFSKSVTLSLPLWSNVLEGTLQYRKYETRLCTFGRLEAFGNRLPWVIEGGKC